MKITLDSTKLGTLTTAGLKVTPARLLVLEVLTNTEKPLSIQDIQKKLGKKSADQATVYRTIEIFKKNGIVRQVNFEHDHAHFELNTNSHHHHIICQNCGKVVDISNCNITSLEKEILKKSGFKSIQKHSLEFFGTCNRCKK